MSGKTAKAERKAHENEPTVKKFALNAEELQNFKRIASTIGFHETTLEGLRTLLKINQAGIEVKHGITGNKPGYKIQTRIDLDEGFLFVKYVKEPKPEEKKEPEQK